MSLRQLHLPFSLFEMVSGFWVELWLATLERQREEHGNLRPM